MELPKLKFSREKVVSLVVSHGEKLLVAIAILCSLPLAWRGLSALRSDYLSPDNAPGVIEQRADNANRRIDQDTDPDSRKKLAAALSGPDVSAITNIDSWRVRELAAGPQNLGLDRPLRGDLRKRGTPTIFPLEQVMAVAGMAAIAKQDMIGVGGDFAPFNPSGDPTGTGTPTAIVSSPPAELMPYAIVSGLIPYKKQVQEYEARYAATSFSDPARDLPIWRDVEVERQEVTPDGDGEWQKLAIDEAIKLWGKSWTGLAQDPLPEEFKIGAQEFYRPDPAPQEVNLFYSPLPTLAERPTLSGAAGPTMTMGGPTWGLSVLHPWAIQEMKTLLANSTEPGMQGPAGFGFPTAQDPQMGGPNDPRSTGPFADSQLSQPEDDPEAMLDDPSLTGMGPDGTLNPLTYRVFRFIDVTVKPGKSYRYRLTSRLWNPNYRVSQKYLEDPKQAQVESLSSANPTVTEKPVRIPSTTRVLIRLVTKDEKKRGGLGSSEELLVLDQNEGVEDKPGSGNYELHATEATIGQLITSKKESRRVEVGMNAQGRPIKKKYPAHDVTTDFTLLGIAGEQELEEKEKKRVTRGFTPPPPLEALLVDSAGNLEHVTAVNSSQLVQDYLPSLPGYRPPQPTEESMMGFPGF